MTDTSGHRATDHSPFDAAPVGARSAVAQVVRGFAMGTADIVPGISGGTVALVTGIYERLIANIGGGAQLLRALLLGRGGLAMAWIRRIEWLWLVALLAGIAAAVLSLSSLISRLLEDHPVRTAAVFFGLVLGAIWITRERVTRWRVEHLLTMLVAAMTLFVVLGLRTDTEAAKINAVTQPAWVFVLAGAVAICAMVLPGISGSLILVMLGMYPEVLAAVTTRDVIVLGALALGFVVGLGSFATLLNWLLSHHHDWVIAAMIGLMLGSLRVLWPWPQGTASTTLGAPTGDVVAPVLLILTGVVAVLAVERLAQRATSAANRAMPSSRSASPSAKENRA